MTLRHNGKIDIIITAAGFSEMDFSEVLDFGNDPATSVVCQFFYTF